MNEYQKIRRYRTVIAASTFAIILQTGVLWVAVNRNEAEAFFAFFRSMEKEETRQKELGFLPPLVSVSDVLNAPLPVSSFDDAIPPESGMVIDTDVKDRDIETIKEPEEPDKNFSIELVIPTNTLLAGEYASGYDAPIAADDSDEAISNPDATVNKKEIGDEQKQQSPDDQTDLAADLGAQEQEKQTLLDIFAEVNRVTGELIVPKLLQNPSREEVVDLVSREQFEQKVTKTHALLKKNRAVLVRDLYTQHVAEAGRVLGEKSENIGAETEEEGALAFLQEYQNQAVSLKPNDGEENAFLYPLQPFVINSPHTFTVYKGGSEYYIISDKDADRVPDAVELRIGTDPLNADSDLDGASDGHELRTDQNSLGPGPQEKNAMLHSVPEYALITHAPLGSVRGVSIDENYVVSGVRLDHTTWFLAGRAYAFTPALVYIYPSSQEIAVPWVTIVYPDHSGEWFTQLPLPLTEGVHSIYVVQITVDGEVVHVSAKKTITVPQDVLQTETSTHPKAQPSFWEKLKRLF